MMNRALRGNETAQLLRVITGVVVVAALYVGRTVFIPLALAFLLSLLLSPVMSFFGTLRIPRIMAIFLMAVILGAIAVSIGYKCAEEFSDLTTQLPLYKGTLDEKIAGLNGLQSSNLGKASDTVNELEKELLRAMPGASDTGHSRRMALGSPVRPLTVEVIPPSNTLASIQTILGPVGSAGLIAIFTIFILMGREDLRNRFIHLASGRRLTVVTQALDEAASRIQRYLLLQSAVNAAYGAIAGIGLHFIGIPNAWLWGLLATTLRFLPYVGPPASAFIPILLSLAVFPGWGHAWATMAFFFVLELSVANIVEPLLYGSQVGLSALAILVAAVFWTLIWGFPGLILSTPLTVCLVVIGRYVPSLSFIGILLENQPAISHANLYYQRLLASDEEEARQVLEQYLKTHGLEKLYGAVVLPALGLIERDRHRNELDDATQNFVMQSTRELIEELGEAGGEQDPPAHAGLKVLCIPAHDTADELGAMLLSQLLCRAGYQSTWDALSPGPDAPDAKDREPDVICISALPPFAIDPARNLYLKLRQRAPHAEIIICLWDFQGDPQKVVRRMRVDTGHAVLATIPEVLERLAGNTAQPVEGNLP